MSNPVNTPAHERLSPRLAAGALTLLLAACATTERPSKARDAAAYNVQLGIAYLHQGDVALAKDKLDRALAEDPSSADVHSARAMLFERMHNPATADAEFRTSLRLAPHDPQVVNNYAVYLCQNGRTEEGVRRFEEAAHNALYRTPEAAYTNAGVCLRAAKRDESLIESDEDRGFGPLKRMFDVLKRAGYVLAAGVLMLFLEWAARWSWSPMPCAATPKCSGNCSRQKRLNGSFCLLWPCSSWPKPRRANDQRPCAP